MKKRKLSRKNLKSVNAKGKTSKPPINEGGGSGKSLVGEAGKSVFSGSLFGLSKEAAAGYWKVIEETGAGWIDWLCQFF